MNEKILELLALLIKRTKKEILIAQTLDNKKNTLEHLSRLKTFKLLSRTIQELDHDLTDADELSGIPGIGEGSLKRIKEILETGNLSELSEPIENSDILDGIENLKTVIGIGPKTALHYVKKYGIKTVRDLKSAVVSKKINVDDKIKLGLKYHGIVKSGIPRSEIDGIKDRITKIIKEVDSTLIVVFCGSYRRMTKISNDIDVVIFSPSIKTSADLLDSKRNIMRETMVALKNSGLILDHITSKKIKTKYMGFIKYDDNPVRRIDIRLIPFISLPAALLAMTGPASLNEIMRNKAKEMGMLLNEYGLYEKKGDKYEMIVLTKEEEIFERLGMKYLSPEERNAYSVEDVKIFSSK